MALPRGRVLTIRRVNATTAEANSKQTAADANVGYVAIAKTYI